jgi:hypothetical protein
MENSAASILRAKKRRHDIQHNDTQHNDTQHNDTQHWGLINDTQQVTFSINDAQQQRSVIVLSLIKLSIAFYLLLCWMLLC